MLLGFFCVCNFVFLATIGAFTCRFLYLIYLTYTQKCSMISSEKSFRVLLCIGSGGHTTELLRLASKLDPDKYSPRLYVAAENDSSSEVKILSQESKTNGSFTISRIPRSRNVNQSFSSSVFSTLRATFSTIPIVYNFKPDIIICNGPGTCVPICVVAFILKCLFLLDCKIVFVESICRVNTLSLTGKIIQHIADIVVVQWPELKDVCYKSKYFGRLT